jgi:hypothetical protein
MGAPPHQYPSNRRDHRDSGYVSRLILYFRAVFCTALHAAKYNTSKAVKHAIFYILQVREMTV